MLTWHWIFKKCHGISSEYLIGSLWGLNWKNVLLCARDTVRDYFRDNNITGMAQTAWWLRLQVRGLDIAVNPSSGIQQSAKYSVL